MERKKENYQLALKYFLFLIVFFILGLAKINFAISPFIVAFLFSLVWCNQNVYVCSLFFVIVNLTLNSFSLSLLISSLFTIFILIFFYLIHKKLKKPINRYIYLLYALLSQIAFLYYSFTTPENLINSIVSVCIMILLLICYNIFFSSIFVKGFSQVFSLNETISASIFLISLSVGLSSVNIINIELIKIFAVFLILLSTFTLNVKSTFIIAICIGVGYALYSYDISFIAVFSLFSLISLLFKSNNKYFASIAIVLIDIFLGLYLKIYVDYSIYSVLSIVLGALAFILIPNSILTNIKNAFGGFNTTELYRNVINTTKQGIIKRLSEVSEVFLDMEINFKNMVKGNLPVREAKELLINEFCSKVCSDCKEKHKCLRTLSEETLHAFNEILDKGFEKGKVNLLDIPPYLASRCNRSSSMLTTFNGLINTYKQYSQLTISQDTSKILIAEQMGGVSKLLKSLVDDTSNNFNFDVNLEDTIKDELKFIHLYCTDVISFVKDGSYNISLIIKKAEINDREIEKILTKIIKTQMKITKKEELNNLFLLISCKNAPKYDCIFGISALTKENSEISGDTYSFVRIDDDKVLMALNDGMGSGENANKTSETSLSLIENFYKAGFDNEIILNSVNKLLTINSEETFSALDICIIDFNKEIFDFIKLGAPIGFIKKPEKVEVVESGSLPIGILEEISPVITKKVISGDEIIILVSDGVIETFNGEENLINFISLLSLLNPQEICDNIIRECSKKTVLDDCTVLALRIFKVV